MGVISLEPPCLGCCPYSSFMAKLCLPAHHQHASPLGLALQLCFEEHRWPHWIQSCRECWSRCAALHWPRSSYMTRAVTWFVWNLNLLLTDKKHDWLLPIWVRGPTFSGFCHFWPARNPWLVLQHVFPFWKLLHMIGRIMAPQKCAHSNPHILWICYLTQQRDFASVIKVKLLWDVRVSCILRWAWCKLQALLYVKEEVRRVRVKQCEKNPSSEDGSGPLAKERRWPLEAGRGKEIDSPLEPPEALQSCWFFYFGPVRHIPDWPP